MNSPSQTHKLAHCHCNNLQKEVKSLAHKKYAYKCNNIIIIVNIDDGRICSFQAVICDYQSTYVWFVGM